MTFHQFYSRFLGRAEDGLHKECRAKDPANCRKCHTGRFSENGDAPEAKARAGKEVWKVFKKDGKELCSYTSRGEGANEEQATKKLLASENGCKPEDIDVVSEYRETVHGSVPGEKSDDDERKITDILAKLAAKNPECEISDLEVISRGNGVFEIKGGMINADDPRDVDNSLWMVRHALLEQGFKDADWETSGDFGFFFKCRKCD